MAFEFQKTKLPGVVIIQPQVFGDSRGYFMETYKKEDYAKACIDKEFVQDNESSSTKGVLRGLHFQKEHTQGKLVRVTSGTVFDVAVDVRPNSSTFGQWVGVTLSAEAKNMLYIPEGFASFVYKCTDVYDPTSEGGIPWNDSDIAVDWPKLDVPYKTSEKDEKHAAFKEQDFTWAKKWL